MARRLPTSDAIDTFAEDKYKTNTCNLIEAIEDGDDAEENGEERDEKLSRVIPGMLSREKATVILIFKGVRSMLTMTI